MPRPPPGTTVTCELVDSSDSNKKANFTGIRTIN